MTERPTPQELAAALNAEFGEGTIKLGSDPSLVVTYWPTGVLPFDLLVGGGIPVGRSIEVYGDYSTLKTYIGLCAVAQVLDASGTAAIVDTEHAFDPQWAVDLGVNTGNLLVEHPEDGETAIRVTETLIRAGIDLIVWDSVAATQPRAYREAVPGSSADQAPARLASMMSSGLRRLNAANRHTALLFINQTRDNVGMTFGPKTTTPGGRALGFYASQRVKLSKAGKVTRPTKTWDGDKMIDVKETVATKIKMTLEKSKLNRPHREVWFQFDHEAAAVDEIGFLMAQGLEHGLIIAGGAGKYSIPGYSDDWSVRGKDKFKATLADDEELQAWLISQVTPSE